MSELTLGFVETKFADIVWDNAPIPSGELVKLCNDILNWKKSTTYTVLKKLCLKGIFENDNGTVKVVLSREEYFGKESENFVEENFKGSLPSFIAAFTKGKKISKKEAEDIKKMIEEASED